ncbi:MAG: MFS transporter [Hyphomicrobiales bacterium]
MRNPFGVDGWTVTVAIARVFLFATFMTIAAAIPVLREEWALSATEAGSIVTSFTVSYAISLFGFGWIADHIGAKRAVAISAVASGIASALFGLLARDYWSALVLYGLVGAAQGGVYTPLIMLFAERTEPARRGTAMGWLIASTSVGYAVSLVLAGTGLRHGGIHEAFLLTGLAPLIGTAILLAALARSENRVHSRDGKPGLVDQMIRNADARRLILGYTAHNFELLGMWAWMPAFLAASFALDGLGTGAATQSSAWFSAGMHIVGATAAFSMGRASDVLGRKRVLVGVAALSALLSLSIGFMIALPTLVLVAIGFVYGFSCIGDSPVLSTALTEAVDPAYLGAVLAVRSLVGFSAGAVAPLVVGATLDIAGGANAGPSLVWGAGFSFSALAASLRQ